MGKLIHIVVFFCLALEGWTKVKITSVDFEKNSDMGKLIVNLKEPLERTPELSIRGKILQIVVPSSFVWPRIKKNVSIDKRYDAQILAYQYTKDNVRVRAVMPYDMSGLSSKVGIVEKEKAIEMFFPLIKKITEKQNPPSSYIEKGSEIYDESYLEKLLNDKEIAKMEEEHTSSDIEDGDIEEEAGDTVGMSMSAQEKTVDWSLFLYIAKFIGFLFLVLMIFFGLIKLLKKGVFNKGKLGFLNSTKVIEVLGKTYIAPKKSILTIRAYDQVFLLGLDEKGMHFLTEIRNKAEFLKEGEKQLVGSNFDTSFDSANVRQKDFNLKEILDKPADSNKKNLGDFLSLDKKKEKVKFSEQIKNKVKDLKSLQ